MRAAPGNHYVMNEGIFITCIVVTWPIIYPVTLRLPLYWALLLVIYCPYFRVIHGREFLFIMTSLLMDQYYYVFLGFRLIVFLLLVLQHSIKNVIIGGSLTMRAYYEGQDKKYHQAEGC
jgi:hypothetical protein